MRNGIFFFFFFLILSRVMSAQNQEEDILVNHSGITFGLFADLDAVANADHHVDAKIQLGYEFYPVKKINKLALELKIGLLKDNYADKHWLEPDKYLTDNYFSYDVYMFYVAASPKLIYPLSEHFALFVDNDFSIGFPSGSVSFRTKKRNNLNNTIPMFMYGINVGVKMSGHPSSYLSLGYTTYNIHELLIKNAPSQYLNQVPQLNSSIWVGINFIF